MKARFCIVGLGEALFDLFPDAAILGGAPLNAAVHAHQLAQRRGGEAAVVSRVGQDRLGQQVFDELNQRGVNTSWLQSDPDHDTGKVYVSFDERGEPCYEIVRNVAWDWLQFDPDLEDLARRCEAVCFGTLAQREAQSRNTVYRFLESASRAVRLFDVNLRQKFFDAAILRRSCELASVLKLNRAELPAVAQLLGVHVKLPETDDLARGLLKRHPNIQALVLTRGELGTVLYTANSRYEGEPISYPKAENADAVGAGDACAAGILVGMVCRLPPPRVVALANHAGAYVASQPGGTPPLPEAVLDLVK